MGEDATNGNENGGDKHSRAEIEAIGAVFEVFGEEDDGSKENSGGEHNVGARERGFLGVTGGERAVADDEEFFENEVGDSHQSDGECNPAEFAVDFVEGFALGPLTDGGDEDSGEVEKGESHEDVGEGVPKFWCIEHKDIIAQNGWAGKGYFLEILP